jgi:hypothetical protein
MRVSLMTILNAFIEKLEYRMHRHHVYEKIIGYLSFG